MCACYTIYANHYIQCYAVSRYAMLCYVIRCDAMRCYAKLRDAGRTRYPCCWCSSWLVLVLCPAVVGLLLFWFCLFVLAPYPCSSNGLLRRGGGGEKGTSRGKMRRNDLKRCCIHAYWPKHKNATGNEPNSRLFRQQFWHKHSLSICRRLLPRYPCCLGRRLLGRRLAIIAQVAAWSAVGRLARPLTWQ